MTYNLENYQKTNLILWIAILSGVIFLTVIVLVFEKLQPFSVDYNFPLITEILFGVAIVLAFAILILKRSIFRLDKILDQSSGLTQSAERVNYVLTQIRRNYIILWTIAESIGMIGFVYYICTADLRNYLLFAIVSIFSLITNFPNKDTIKLCLDNLGYSGPAV